MLIIVRLPFAVPDPLREAEKERYATLPEYIRDIIVPDMQKKLRQGFGRAIRTESDTCVVSILDHRAVAGGRYHEDVLCALPACQMAESIEDVEALSAGRNRKDIICRNRFVALLVLTRSGTVLQQKFSGISGVSGEFGIALLPWSGYTVYSVRKEGSE